MAIIRTCCLSVTVLGVVATCLGCADSKAKYSTARLEGLLSIDGSPVLEGSVQFQPQGSGQPDAGVVKDGRYVAERVPLGKVRVLFTAIRETGKIIREGTHEFPERMNLVPPKFRAGLNLEVTGDNPSQNFALSSK